MSQAAFWNWEWKTGLACDMLLQGSLIIISSTIIASCVVPDVRGTYYQFRLDFYRDNDDDATTAVNDALQEMFIDTNTRR